MPLLRHLLGSMRTNASDPGISSSIVPPSVPFRELKEWPLNRVVILTQSPRHFSPQIDPKSSRKKSNFGRNFSMGSLSDVIIFSAELTFTAPTKRALKVINYPPSPRDNSQKIKDALSSVFSPQIEQQKWPSILVRPATVPHLTRAKSRDVAYKTSFIYIIITPFNTADVVARRVHFPLFRIVTVTLLFIMATVLDHQKRAANSNRCKQAEPHPIWVV